MLLNNRHGSVDSDSYRYGFNGMEGDAELKGHGNSYDFGARMYDPRVARWFAPDPLEKKHAYLSPYAYSGNIPILLHDYNGEDFGVKINHKDRTVTFVSNVHTVSTKTYEQALKAVELWNKKSLESGGYTISFEIQVIEPPLTLEDISDSSVICEYPGESFTKNNGSFKNKKINRYKKKLLAKQENELLADGVVDRIKEVAKLDLIGNLYASTDGEHSKTINGAEGGMVAGITDFDRFISMNTITGDVSPNGDMGSYSTYVAHELGHTFGLDDKKKGKYYSDGGIMDYDKLKGPSDDDIRQIINYILDTYDKPGSKMQIIEEIDESGNVVQPTSSTEETGS